MLLEIECRNECAGIDIKTVHIDYIMRNVFLLGESKLSLNSESILVTLANDEEATE